MKKTRAEYQAEYRRKHPEYVARCRELEKPKLEQYRKNTEKHKRDRIIREWLREGMITEGWKIEITHVFRGKIETNRKMVTEDMMFNSHNQVLKYTFEEMLEELGYK